MIKSIFSFVELTEVALNQTGHGIYGDFPDPDQTLEFTTTIDAVYNLYEPTTRGVELMINNHAAILKSVRDTLPVSDQNLLTTIYNLQKELEEKSKKLQTSTDIEERKKLRNEIQWLPKIISKKKKLCDLSPGILNLLELQEELKEKKYIFCDPEIN